MTRPVALDLPGSPVDDKALQALRTEVALARDRERAWQAVSDTARDLTVLREPERVLQAIVERGRALLGSHVAWIAGPDPQRDDALVVLAIDGVSTEWAQQMRAASGRGVVGYVRQTQAPFATADYFAETRVVHDAQLDATLRSEGVQSMVAVPMLSGADFLGVLVLADRAARHYTHPDIATLGTLAAHAVLAVRNAQAFALTRAALAQAESSNALLQQKSAALELAADAHERLTRLVAQGGTLLDVCRTVASLLDAAVLVVDAADTVLCSATPGGAPALGPGGALLAGRLQDGALHAALDASRISGRSVRLPARAGAIVGGILGRAGSAAGVPGADLEVGADGADGADGAGQLAAIVGGGRMLGGMLVCSRAPLSDVALRTLERSALVLALLLLAPGRQADAPAGWPTGWLIDLLNPLRAGSAALARQAAAQGLPGTVTPVLALLVPGAATALPALLRSLRARLDARHCWVDELDGAIVVLASEPAPEALCQALKLALPPALADPLRLQATGLVSARCAGLAALPAAFAALQRGQALLGALGHGGSIRLLAELAPYLAAFGSATDTTAAALTGYVDALIGPLLAQDRARGGQLAPTLLAYLDGGCNAKATAGRLGVHVNTLNNRLAAAAALVGHWHAPGRGLALHLALRLTALRAAPAPPPMPAGMPAAG